MSDFFKAIKDDLTDRRLLPIVICVGVLLLGAVAYAALAGGGSGSSPSAAVAVAHTPGASAGIAVSQAENDLRAGPRRDDQRQRLTAPRRRPRPLRAAPRHDHRVGDEGRRGLAAHRARVGGSASSSSRRLRIELLEQRQLANRAPATPTRARRRSRKPSTTWRCSSASCRAASTPENAELPSYENLTKPTPLPNSKEALIEFLGVTVSHVGTQYSATFALEGEVILHGTGTCRPSAAQCKVLDLKEKETEQLEYLTATGELATWELRVVSITSSKASSAAVASAAARTRRTPRARRSAGAHVLGDAGMRYSAQSGLIVLVGHPAFGHAASRRHR